MPQSGAEHERRGAAWLSPSSVGTPVSYTHLDVYKRQLMERYLGASIEVRAVVDRAHPELVIEP